MLLHFFVPQRVSPYTGNNVYQVSGPQSAGHIAEAKPAFSLQIPDKCFLVCMRSIRLYLSLLIYAMNMSSMLSRNLLDCLCFPLLPLLVYLPDLFLEVFAYSVACQMSFDVVSCLCDSLYL